MPIGTRTLDVFCCSQVAPSAAKCLFGAGISPMLPGVPCHARSDLAFQPKAAPGDSAASTGTISSPIGFRHLELGRLPIQLAHGGAVILQRDGSHLVQEAFILYLEHALWRPPS